MTTGHVFLAISLDGFVARKDHSLDWLQKAHTTGGDLGTGAFMASVDAMVMGRGSFETMLKMQVWPYEFPVTVLSSSLRQDDIPPSYRSKVRLSADTPQAVMQQLADEGHKRVYIDGGQLVHSFIRAGLIEDMVLTVIPILLGQGVSLFGPLDQDIRLQLRRSEHYDSGIVQNTYQLPQT